MKEDQARTLESLNSLFSVLHSSQEVDTSELEALHEAPRDAHSAVTAQQATKRHDATKRQGMKGLLDMLFRDEEDDDGAEERRPSQPLRQARISSAHAHPVTKTRSLHTQSTTADMTFSSIIIDTGPSENRLTTMMRKQGETLPSLLRIVLQHRIRFTIKNTCFALRLTAKLYSDQSCDNDRHMRSHSSFNARADADALSKLLKVLKQQVSCSLDQLGPKQVAIVMWSLGTLGHGDPVLVPNLLMHARQLLDRMQPSELGTVGWACAKLGAVDAAFLDAFESAAARVLSRQLLAPEGTERLATIRPSVRGQGGGNNKLWLELMSENEQICNIAWSMAELNRYSRDLFQIVISILSQRLHTVHASLLATVVWAMHKAGHQDADFTTKAMLRIADQVKELEATHLVKLLPALKTLPLAMVAPGNADSERRNTSGTASCSSGQLHQQPAASSAVAVQVWSDDLQDMRKTWSRLVVEQLQWLILCRRRTQVEALTATELLDAMRAVVALNERNLRMAAATLDRTRGRLGTINHEWQQQQRQWQQKHTQLQAQQKQQKLKRPPTGAQGPEARLSPVVLATYDDVLFLRVLMDRVVELLLDYQPSELLQLLRVCARVGFAHNQHLVRGCVDLLRAAKLSAEEQQLLSGSLSCLDFSPDQERVLNRSS